MGFNATFNVEADRLRAARQRTARRLRDLRAYLRTPLELKLAKIGREFRAMERERDELRAVLRPLLERGGLAWYQEDCCQFCGEISGLGTHADDCPVLRRATLLGRPAGEQPT